MRFVLRLVVIEYEQRILIMILRDHPIEVTVLAGAAEDRPNHLHLEISIVFARNLSRAWFVKVDAAQKCDFLPFSVDQDKRTETQTH